MWAEQKVASGTAALWICVEDKNQTKLISDAESIAYLGLSFADLVKNHGAEAAKDLYEKHGRHIFLPLQTLEKILRKLNPDFVVATNSPRAEQAALLMAKKLSIPSLCIVDHFDLRDVRGRLSGFGYGSKICVFNPYIRDRLLEVGRKPEEIVVTGNPAFDELFSSEYITLKKAYIQTYNLTKGKTILWARSVMQGDLDIANAVEKKLIEFALENPDYSLVVRPHPNEPGRSVPAAKNIILSDRTEKAAVVLHAADLVVTLYSTLGLEAYLLGKKVIQYTPTRHFHEVDWTIHDMAIGVHKISDLEETIRSELRAQQSNEIRMPKATQAIIDVFLNLMAKEQKAGN